MSTPSGQAGASHIAALQMLRAIAALAVVVFHTCDSLHNSLGQTPFGLFPIGANGVDIFFVLSGFIICYVTQRETEPLKFLQKRAIRIVPLYYLLTVGIFLIALVMPHLLRTTAADPVALIKSLLFIPYARIDGTVQPVLFLGWTLNFEAFFYVLFAFGLLLPAHRIAVAISLLAAFVAMGLIFDTNSVAFEFYTRGIIIEFVWGCLVFLVYSRRPDILRAWRWAWPIPAALILAQNFVHPHLPQEIAIGIPAALLVALILPFQTENTALGRFFSLLGDASYSIYLIHPYIAVAVVYIVAALAGSSYWAALLTSFLIVAITILVSLALFYLVERPSNTWLRKKLMATPPNAAPATI